MFLKMIGGISYKFPQFHWGYFFLAYGHGKSAGLVDAFAGQSAHTTEGCQELISEAFGRRVVERSWNVFVGETYRVFWFIQKGVGKRKNERKTAVPLKSFLFDP